MDRIMRADEVVKVVGLSKAQLYLMMKEKEFPQAVQLGRRAVGWKESQIAEWIESRKESA